LTLPYSEEGKISAVTPGVGIQGEGFVLSDTKSFSRVTATYTTFNHTPDIYIKAFAKLMDGFLFVQFLF
jgi:hypothetical protein